MVLPLPGQVLDQLVALVVSEIGEERRTDRVRRGVPVGSAGHAGA
jgi:hypothetical protein